MSLIKDKIKSDLIAAQKAGDKSKVESLRLLNSEIKNKEISEKKELKDEDVVAVLTKEAKKRRDSITAYQQANRDDLKEKEEAELKLIEAYLPAQMSEDQVRQAVDKIIAENPSLEFGPLMGKVMGALKGQADGALVNRVVQEKLKK